MAIVPRLRTLALATLIALGSPVLAAHADARPDTWAQPLDTSFNLYRMSPTLYRSAMPHSQDVALLEKLGVHSVLTFTKPDDKAWLGGAPVQVLRYPTHADHVDDADVIAVLHILQTAQQQGPVLMHCSHGRDRTGLFAAMYRIVIQGWSKEEALKEMVDGGFGHADDMGPAIHYVQNVEVEAVRTAMREGRCSTSLFSLCNLKGLVEGSLGTTQAAAPPAPAKP
ncbi:protein tyrosine phosphatase TpbA [Pseudomonas knackmussii B13]|uniref:Protein tyrosine phosphatase TpbA n=1 Tax=Pseudomonas knackmussii (strain DSM 6978 / CCUG 54928 / LMG 23759 / B13) TaxID=1301098 RepID=A0A024HCW2_PSEKB|nr:tyrosine-protein phosphatase [Pseudomonas knackmussii]CDF82318.1 protein tyrosine phosphatase TpbA [Pseudomonas knackmussii B13]